MATNKSSQAPTLASRRKRSIESATSSVGGASTSPYQASTHRAAARGASSGKPSHDAATRGDAAAARSRLPSNVEWEKLSVAKQKNCERAFTAASRRSDRDIDARYQSALTASDMHFLRTGRYLRVTREMVENEEMYEEDDSHPRRWTANLNQDTDPRMAAFNKQCESIDLKFQAAFPGFGSHFSALGQVAPKISGAAIPPVLSAAPQPLAPPLAAATTIPLTTSPPSISPMAVAPSFTPVSSQLRPVPTYTQTTSPRTKLSLQPATMEPPALSSTESPVHPMVVQPLSKEMLALSNYSPTSYTSDEVTTPDDATTQFPLIEDFLPQDLIYQSTKEDYLDQHYLAMLSSLSLPWQSFPSDEFSDLVDYSPLA